MSTKMSECNDNLRMQPCNTFIIGSFPFCLSVLASGNMLLLSVYIMIKNIINLSFASYRMVTNFRHITTSSTNGEAVSLSGVGLISHIGILSTETKNQHSELFKNVVS